MKTKISRKTRETDVSVEINLKGVGKYKIGTGIPFLNHMLELFAHHGGFDLKVNASGDTDIDDHHLIEDVGITLGQAIKKALGGKKGIKRYGNFLLPMDEALSYVAVDVSSRPYLSFKAKFARRVSEKFDYELLEDFFKALASNASITLHIKVMEGRSNHHIAESIFKGFGKALAEAVSKGRGARIPSTKGRI
jgi:imidazoleglycerol-phosphate dehydratase